MLDELHSPTTTTDDTILQDKSASQEAHLLTSEREEEHSEEVKEIEIEEFDEESVLDFQPIKPLESILDEEASIVEAASNAKKAGQSTLLKFTEKNSECPDASLESVMEDISNLSIKVDNIGKQHASLAQLAFEDDETRANIVGIRAAENIMQLVEVAKLLQWFYDESSETAVLQCLPCFKMHLASKPTLANLTPLQAQRIINSQSRGTLATGIFFDRKATRRLIEGHNATWHHQKGACIEHLCLIGGGSKLHKKAMENHKKEAEMNEKKSTATMNIFQAAIVDVKIGAAGVHFETLLSFLALCSVNVGSIGHSRNKFNDTLYCLEKNR